jgi:hypothetical protein
MIGGIKANEMTQNVPLSELKDSFRGNAQLLIIGIFWTMRRIICEIN